MCRWRCWSSRQWTSLSWRAPPAPASRATPQARRLPSCWRVPWMRARLRVLSGVVSEAEFVQNGHWQGHPERRREERPIWRTVSLCFRGCHARLLVPCRQQGGRNGGRSCASASRHRDGNMVSSQIKSGDHAGSKEGGAPVGAVAVVGAEGTGGREELRALLASERARRLMAEQRLSDTLTAPPPQSRHSRCAPCSLMIKRVFSSCPIATNSNSARRLIAEQRLSDALAAPLPQSRNSKCASCSLLIHCCMPPMPGLPGATRTSACYLQIACLPKCTWFMCPWSLRCGIVQVKASLTHRASFPHRLKRGCVWQEGGAGTRAGRGAAAAAAGDMGRPRLPVR